MFGSGSSGFWDAGISELTSSYPLQAGSSELTGLCQGDFYREQDDGVRGVSIAPPSAQLWTGSGLGSGIHMGNSFFETEHDVFGMQSFGLGAACLKDGTLAPSKGLYDDAFPAWPSLHEESLEQFQPLCEASDQFQPGDKPPSAPSSEHFRLEPTTVFVTGALPHEIGNRILTFFRSQVVASITKVRPTKYTVRTEVFEESAVCSMKVRVYRVSDNPSCYSVEFQRRSGCAFAFRGVYDRASEFLGAAFTTSGGSTALQVPRQSVPPLPSVGDDELGFADVLPLLEMAGMVSLQAEAAVALCKLADGGRGCVEPLLQAPEETGVALEQLIASNSLEAAYPAALTLIALAAYPEARPLFTAPGLLQAAVKGAGATVVPSAVRVALAQSVGAGVRSCAAQADLSRELMAGLQTELEGTLQGSNVDSFARGHLEEALFTIQALPCH